MKFHSFLTSFGFVRSSADQCVYVLKEEKCITVIAIWVDDGLVCSSHPSKLASVVDFLAKQFEMTSGPADCFVGIQIARDRLRKTIHVSQENYIKRLLEKFGLSDCSTRVVPADPFTRLSKDLGRDSSTCQTPLLEPFREAVGSLIYAVTCTRLDIAFAVSQVSQFSSSPTKAHWDAVKRIFSYLKGTLNYGITFGNFDSRNKLLAYTDADFASNQDDRCSTTGVILLLNGGPVSWKSQRQKCVSLLTTESEYVAAATAAKEVVWMRRLLQDLRLPQSAPTTLFCDNQSSIKLVQNAEFHQRTKHIDVKFHFIRALQEEQANDVTYINTDVQLADILTKALNGPRFAKLREEISITVHVC